MGDPDAHGDAERDAASHPEQQGRRLLDPAEDGKRRDHGETHQSTEDPETEGRDTTEHKRGRDERSHYRNPGEPTAVVSNLGDDHAVKWSTRA